MPWCPYSTIQDDGVTGSNRQDFVYHKTTHRTCKRIHHATTGLELPRAGDVAGTINGHNF